MPRKKVIKQTTDEYLDSRHGRVMNYIEEERKRQIQKEKREEEIKKIELDKKKCDFNFRCS